MHAKNNNDMQEINKLKMHEPVEEAWKEWNVWKI